MTPVLVALGAAVGAPLRWWVGQRLDRPALPWGTFAVNVAGSFVLGLLAGLAVEGHVLALLGTGFCGGLTTYSSFAVQTATVGREDAGAGARYAVLTVVAGLAACWVGFVLGA